MVGPEGQGYRCGVCGLGEASFGWEPESDLGCRAVGMGGACLAEELWREGAYCPLNAQGYTQVLMGDSSVTPRSALVSALWAVPGISIGMACPMAAAIHLGPSSQPG